MVLDSQTKASALPSDQPWSTNATTTDRETRGRCLGRGGPRLPFANPALRLAYIAAYVGNIPPARGLCWASGLLCRGILLQRKAERNTEWLITTLRPNFET